VHQLQSLVLLFVFFTPLTHYGFDFFSVRCDGFWIIVATLTRTLDHHRCNSPTRQQTNLAESSEPEWRAMGRRTGEEQTMNTIATQRDAVRDSASIMRRQELIGNLVEDFEGVSTRSALRMPKSSRRNIQRSSFKSTIALGLLASMVPTTMAACISLTGSKVCPAFDSYAVSNSASVQGN
jgi:hypothetical protein